MRVTALVLGILGGLGALFGTFIVLGGAALSSTSSSAQAAATTGSLGGASVWGFALTVLAFVGAGLAMTKPRAAALILLIAGIGLFITIGGFGLFSAPLLLIASLLAFLGRAPKVKAPASTPAVVE